MPQQPQQSPSFIQQYLYAKWLMQFPALTLMVFLRRDIGYRLLRPLALIAVFGLVFVVAVLATPGNEAARPMDLAVFAVVGFLNGLAQLIRHWWNLNRAPHQLLKMELLDHVVIGNGNRSSLRELGYFYA